MDTFTIENVMSGCCVCVNQMLFVCMSGVLGLIELSLCDIHCYNQKVN